MSSDPSNTSSLPPRDRTLQLRRTHAIAVLVATALVAGAGGWFGHRYLAKPPAEAASQGPVKRLPLRNFGHWNLQCVEDAKGAKHCDVMLRVVDKDSQKLVLSLLVGRNLQAQNVFIVITPPNANSIDGVKLAAGDKDHQLPFEGCQAGSCRAFTMFDEGLQAELAASAKIGITYHTKAGREVHYDLPNDGFQDAVKSWMAETAG